MTRLEIDEVGDVVTLDGEVVIGKQYGYDFEDADVVVAMVEAYNGRAKLAEMRETIRQMMDDFDAAGRQVRS